MTTQVTSLRISEIFFSLQGEAKTVGIPTVFIRLTGCPLRCAYCDTEYAFSGGEMKTFDDILGEVAAFSPRYITVTGGEPLAQKNCIQLLTLLCDSKYVVSLETSGALDVSEVDERVSIVHDLKTPGSGEVSKNLYSNLALLKPKDQIKFVICDRQDYDWAAFKMSEYNLASRVDEILFSPSHEQLEAKDLADWIVKDNLGVRLQIQLHKYLWGDKQGV
ncbi:MAG: 7-carboxy-7-deazaguanine synthase [Candidatus Azotimanducaceae bacterium]